ncbi:YcaO-like family protein [Prodigiosinella aquatilis]|nr:YcaO-like family protein [Prodigiosinella sp. LS101]WJV53222.1 YcaO-like family protein [Prodigiosinella sp. LS101]WJV57582.1 YcaO-like family protein [Pectobacteriaceae bacterium C111]
MFRLSSSFRTRTAEDSLKLAKSIALDMGVTRVTNVTWLDKIGIPVFAGIRPYASKGSLNVHAGKGIKPNEAKIGAYMESIEFSLVDDIHHADKIHLMKSADILASYNNLYSLSSFGIRLGEKISSDDDIYCVKGHDIINNIEVMIPAELVFHPFQHPQKKYIYGGTTTNGLCSGNTSLEAIIHGICEVLERDVQSFNHIQDKSLKVDISTEPESIRVLRHKIEEAGLILVLRKTINQFNLPFFSAYVLEKTNSAYISIADGFGLHPVAEIAAIRAVTEAVQSRLSHIHGGRDDIIDRVKHFKDKEAGLEEQVMGGLRERVTQGNKYVNFISEDESVIDFHNIEQLYEYLKAKLITNNLNGCIHVELSPKNFPFSVQRVIIPNAEYVEPGMKRIGYRFAEAFKKNKNPLSAKGM